MAVLKISGSKQKPAGVAIGIDLGTTHSLVAVYHDHQLQVIPDDMGNVLLPSVVHYTDTTCHVGTQDMGSAAPAIRSIKRLMGRGTEELTSLALPVAYPIVSEQGPIQLKTPMGNRTAVEISAEILKTLLVRAQKFVGNEAILGAVVTVPAYFDEVQRQATKQAALLAGLPILRLINEPTAAAIAYGLNQTEQGTCLVFDLGGGTFDISLLSMQSGVFEVLATGGDTLLGGDDIDRLVAEWIAHSAKLSTTDNPDLMQVAKTAKEALTTEVVVMVTYQDWTGSLSRDTFNSLISPLLQKMMSHCDRVLLDAHIDKLQISEMVLVGGATRMPVLREQLTAWLGKPVHTELNPDQVVALGAALQADQLTGNRAKQNLLLLDVIPLSLGLEMMSGTVEKMVMRNSPLPASRTEMFTTYQDNQTGLMLHVVQGERELVKDCRSLARFHLKGFPPMLAGKAKIKVVFQVDADGLLTVTAEELTSNTHTEVVIEATSGLSDIDISDLIEDSIVNAESDMKSKRLHELKHESQQLLKLAKADLIKWGSKLLSASELLAIQSQSVALEAALESENLKQIETCQKEYEVLVAELAERKLNFSLMLTLEGKRIEEVLDA